MPKNQLCVDCSTQHEGVCTLPVSCPNCKGEHHADHNQCPFRAREAEVLSSECKNFLSFIDARRQFFAKKSEKSFAKIIVSPQSDPEPLKKFFEIRTHAMIKIINEVLEKKYKCCL